MAEPTPDPSALAVVDNPAASRVEATVDGHLAQLVYRREGNRLLLVHTEVPDELEGRGLGGRLVEAALELAGREHLEVVPLCPFARRWIQRHPERVEGVTIRA